MIQSRVPVLDQESYKRAGAPNDSTMVDKVANTPSLAGINVMRNTGLMSNMCHIKVVLDNEPQGPFLLLQLIYYVLQNR